MTEATASCRREIELEIPAEEVSKSMEKIARDIARVARVPGFRPGKAPVTRRSGKSELVVANRLACNGYLRDAVQQWAFCSLNSSGWAPSPTSWGTIKNGPGRRKRPGPLPLAGDNDAGGGRARFPSPWWSGRRWSVPPDRGWAA